MADFTFDGASLVQGSILSPISGLWSGDIYFEDLEVPSVGQFGELQILGTTWSGSVTDVGTDGGFARARIIGGANKFDESLPPQEWRGYTLGQIAHDCLSEAGEVVGTGWDSLTISCAHWQRSQGPLREALRRVSRLIPPDLHWRCTPDGQIALVDDSSWPDGTDSVDVDMFPFPHERCVQWFPIDGVNVVGKALTLFGIQRRILRAEYRWNSHEITVRGWY